MYVLGCKLSICYRQISDFRCKLLVIPYASLKMEYYPGNIINSSEVDYKAKILGKGEKISSAGSVYLQKAISVGRFVGLAFLKVDAKRVSDSLKLGIKTLLSQVEQIEGPIQLDTLIFPLCDQLGHAALIIESFLENLEKCRKVKEVFLGTNQPQQFIDAISEFSNVIEEEINENKILMT